MIRPACLADADAILVLRNHPEAVFWSGKPPVSEIAHAEWFPRAVSHDILLVVDLPPRGVVGYARMSETGQVSLALDPTLQGQGWGRRLIVALEEPARTRGRTHAYAFVHPSNIASIRAFMHAGYGLSSAVGIFQKVLKAL